MRETLVAALMFAQPLPGAGSTGGTAPVSPSVMATDMCVVDAAGRGTLELLILWRGSPGWFRRATAVARAAAVRRIHGGGPSPMIRSAWVSQGGVSLSVRFDPRRGRSGSRTRRSRWTTRTSCSSMASTRRRDRRSCARFASIPNIRPRWIRRLVAGWGAGRRCVRSPCRSDFIRRSPELVEFLQCDIRCRASNRTNSRSSTCGARG